MDEEEITKVAKSESKSILASLPIEIRWAIGGLLVYFLFLGEGTKRVHQPKGSESIETSDKVYY